MKNKTMFILLTLFLVSLTLNQSCKKWEREQPRLRFWPFRTVNFIMKTSWTSYESILKNIKNGRTTTGQFFWTPDTLIMNGPAGYNALTAKALKEWKKAVNDNLMPDTTKLTQSGDIIVGLKLFLDERQKHTANKAWAIIKLAIPRKEYKTYPHFWEKLLTAIKDYYTGTIGGSSEYTDGVRNLQQEKDICNLISAPDPDDPWGYTCSALTHYESIFKAYAEGDNKALKVGLVRDAEGKIMDVSMSMNDAQTREADIRYKTAVAKYGINVGNPEDYKTKYEEDADGGFYYIELDVTEGTPTTIEE